MDWSGAFDVEGVYLDSASVGLPPRTTTAALHAELDRWAQGAARATDYDIFVERSRQAFATLVRVPPGWVSCGNQASVFAGIVAHATPRDGVILVPEGEFTSVTFPFAAQGHRVREVPLADLADAINAETRLVSFAAVQSSDGTVADLDAITGAAERHGCWTMVDLTQAAGWLPVDASRFDFTICGAYKWLLSPRGTAFLTARPARAAELTPLLAGWYAGADRWSSIYGLPLRLADDGRRFDVSPAWHSWLGTAYSLDFLATVDPAARQAHAVGLANEFRRRVGLPAGDSAIVSTTVTPEATRRLSDAGVVASMRAGRLRSAFWIHNTLADVDAAAAALAG